MDIREISPLGMAFLGDGVFGLLVRERLVKLANCSVDKLHKNSVKFVSASAQADIFKILMPHLTEKEHEIFKRGRNAHTSSVPKNSSVTEYRTATGVETLFGWLHLNGESERIQELFELIWEVFSEKILF